MWIRILKRCIHFNDNSNIPNASSHNFDRLYKVRPLLHSIELNFNDIKLDWFLSVHELIIPFKGKSGLK